MVFIQFRIISYDCQGFTKPLYSEDELGKCFLFPSHGCDFVDFFVFGETYEDVFKNFDSQIFLGLFQDCWLGTVQLIDNSTTSYFSAESMYQACIKKMEGIK